MLPARDTELLRILDNELADATARGGAHLACRPGCTPCCHGVFRISALDAARLEWALTTHPDRIVAAAIRERAEALVAALAPYFPGDPRTGALHDDTDTADTDAAVSDKNEAASCRPEEPTHWERFADLPEADGPCPVLDPATGRCELYAARPLTCRVFGPPVRNEGGIGICELCYQGASEAEILAGEMHCAHAALEAELDAEMAAAGHAAETVIAWALTRPHALRRGRAKP